jgi:PAS domain S-box-containing protein
MFSFMASVVVSLIGALALIGWLFNVADLKSVYGAITMKANTTVALILAGVSLFYLRDNRSLPRRIGEICAALIAILGLMTLSEHVFGWNLHIDQLLFEEAPGALATTSPNRMGVTASSCLAMSGISMLLLNRRKLISVAQVLTILAGLWALLSVIGYAYQAEQLYAIAPYTGIALHTAVALFLLSLGILVRCIDDGFTSIFCDEGAAGIMARQLAIVGIVAPFVLCWLRLVAQREGYVDLGLGAALLVLAIIIIFLLSIWRAATELRFTERERLVATSALREREKELERSRDNAEAILRTSPVPLLVLDKDLRVVTGNEAFYERFHVEAENTEGRLVYDLGNGQWNIPALRKLLEDILPQRSWFRDFEVTHEFERIGRRTMLLNARRMEVEAGGPERIVLVIEDITVRKQAVDALRESEKNLEAELHSAQALQKVSTKLIQGGEIETLYEKLIDAAMAIMHADFASMQMLYPERGEGGELRLLTYRGYSPESAAAWEWIGADHPTTCGMAFRTGQRCIVTNVDTCDWMAGSQDLEFYRQLSIRSLQSTPLLSRSGTQLGMISTCWKEVHEPSERELRLLDVLARQAGDLIERKQAEDERERLLERELKMRQEAEQVNRVKDEFLATISHELRTPLNAMLGWATMLKRGKADQSTVAHGIEAIERNAKAQAQLIEDMLDASRIITGKMRLDIRSISLTPIVKAAIDSVQPAADAKEIRLEMVVDPTADKLRADEARLQQVIWNLLSNGIKFTPRGGRIKVKIGRSDSMAEITVTDTGEGISKEFLPLVFDRFKQADASTTRKHGGLGLGLAITRHLIELHGGTIKAESDGPGKGSAFSVRLPLAPIIPPNESNEARSEATGLQEARKETKPPSLVGVRILAIDDLQDTRDMLRNVLAHYGADVTTASSAVEGLAVMAGWRPDVIVCDIGMPGEDGYSFIARVRNLEPVQGGKIPAIALTGYVRVEDRMRSLEAGYQMFVPKPVEADELAASIVTVCANGHDSTSDVKEQS